MAATHPLARRALVLGACLALAAAGANLADAQVGSTEFEPVDSAPVILDGNQLFQVRGISTYSSDRRADGIAQRIAAVAADRDVSPDPLRIVPQDPGLALVVGGERVVVLLPSDAELESVSLLEFAAACQLRTQEAIRNYRRDRDPGRTLRSAGLRGGSGRTQARAPGSLARPAGDAGRRGPARPAPPDAKDRIKQAAPLPAGGGAAVRADLRPQGLMVITW